MANSKILVCDDDDMLIELLVHRIGARGFAVVAARDGGEALRLAKDERPDAIVLDAIRQASAISLLANRRTRVVFVARAISLAVFAAGALILHALIGFEGILWATAAASAAGAVIVLGAALATTRTETH